MSVLARIASIFVLPVDGSTLLAAPSVRQERTAQTVVVVADRRHLALAACVVAAASVEPAGAGAALVCSWGAEQPDSERLGRATCVALPEDPQLVHHAIAEACRAAPPGPLVLAIGGPRPAEFEELLAAADAVIVAWGAEQERPVAELAFARARRPGQTGGVLRLPGGLRARAALQGVGDGAAVREAAVLLQRVPYGAGEPRAEEVRHALAQPVQ